MFQSTANLSCLDNMSTTNLISESNKPGVFYDFDHQCRFAYGQNASHCKNRAGDECNEVWCSVGNQNLCFSKGDKAAEGTLCGDGFNSVNKLLQLRILLNLKLISFLFESQSGV